MSNIDTFGNYWDCSEREQLLLLQLMIDCLYHAAELLVDEDINSRDKWDIALHDIGLVVYNEQISKQKEFYKSINQVEYLYDYDSETITELIKDISWLALDVLQHMGFIGGGNAGLEINNHIPTMEERNKTIEMIKAVADYPLADLRDPKSIIPGLISFGPDGLDNWSR